MRFQNSPASHHGPASLSVMEADWLSDATELLRPVAENRFLLAPARWMSRMSEPKPDRCYWRISFTFFTLNWNSLSHGNEKSLHDSSCKALKTSWIKEWKKTTKKQMNHPEKVFLSWRCLSTTRHNYSFIYLHSTQTNYIKLHVDKAEWGDVGASASDSPPPPHPTLPSSLSVETWNWVDSTCSQVSLCSPLITGGKTNGSAASVLFVCCPSQSQQDYSK